VLSVLKKIGFIIPLLSLMLISCSKEEGEDVRTGYCRYMPLAAGNWWTYHYTRESQNDYPVESDYTMSITNHFDNYDGYEAWEMTGDKLYAYGGSICLKHKNIFEVICGENMEIGDQVNFGVFSTSEMTLVNKLIDPVWGDILVFHGELSGSVETQAYSYSYSSDWTEKYAANVGVFSYEYDYQEWGDSDNWEHEQWILTDYNVQ
jgi:hypothetical protein